MDINRSVIYDGAGDDEDHVFHQSDNQLQRNDSNDYVRGMANTERGNLHSMSTFKQEGNDKLYGASIYTGKSLKQSNNQWGRSGPVSDGSGNYSRNINYAGDRTIDETFYTRTHNKNTNNGATSQNDIDHRHMERLPKSPTEYDANSKSSFGETDATPQWANMALKPTFTDNYLRQKWPRISLRALNYRPSDPTLVQDGDIILADKDNKERTEKTKKTACYIVVGILLIIMVTAPAIVLIVLASDTQQDSTDIYAVNMELSVDEDFTSDHNDTESAVYKSFTSKFCSEIDTVYRNTTTGFGEGYKGCAVNNVKKGSIIVIFALYITGVSQTQVNTLDAKLNESLQINSYYLGTFIVIVGSIKITSFTIIQTVPVVSTPSQGVVTSAITSVSTEDITTSSILVSITKADTTTVTTTPDTTTSTTEADTIKSTTTPDMTTSTTKARTITSTTTPDTTTSTTEADTITSTTAPDTTTSTTETNSTTEANSTTQTTEADSTTPSTTAGTTTEADTTTKTIVTDTTTSTTADTTTSSTEDDTTTSTTEADTTISTTALATTTSTTEADTTSTTAPDTTTTTTFSTKTDITTSTIVPDTTTTTAPDTPTSTMIAETTKTTTAPETTTSTTPADTTTSTSASDTTITTRESDATKLTTATETTTSTTPADTTTSTTASDTTITTTESDATKLTTATDKTTSTTEVDTTTSTTVADATKSTRIADTSPATTATDATTITEANTIQSTATVSTTTSTTEADTTTSTTEADTTTSTTEADTSTQTPEADTTTSKTTVGTTTSTTIVGTTTSTTEADTTTSTTMEDTTTPTTEADTFTSTTDGDTTTSITEADTTVSTTEAYTTTSTTAADTSTSTTEADTTTLTIAADTTTSTTEADTTTSTIAADTTTSTTEADTTTSTTEVDTTTSTTEADTTTSTTEADTTTSTAATTITSTITETTGTTIPTTTVQQADVNCPDALFTIGNPAVYNCTLSGTEFTEISVSNLDRTPSKLASIDKNGTVTYEPQVALTVKLVPAEKIELMFSDITCSDEGIYEITVTGEPGDTKSTGRIAVQRVPVAPTLNMHADQVIDLQFYRLGSENECKAEVGYPPGYLVIEVKNNNSSTYEELPPLDISFVDNTTISGNCSNKQLLKFGMNYTSAMDNGKIRCRVESPVVGETISTEKDLFLIPRDICTCNTVNSGVKRGHPKRCDVYVECVVRDYPFGVLCPSPQCRNSISGECSNNCSEIICKEEVPQDFCTTLPPSTTTPAPSLYISCNESVGFLIYTETVSVICVLNQTSNFQVVNITKVTTSEEDVAEIAQNGNVELLTDDDNIDVTYESDVIKVTFKNVSCLDEGAYRFSVQFGEDIATAQTSVSVLQKPNNPATLTLDPDQIADLGFYRADRRHSCDADIGYPAGTLNVEMLNEGESEFKVLDLPAGYTVTDTKSNCMVNRKLEFGIEFTSAMNGAIIRCAVENNNFEEEFISFSQNETASLVPHDFCINSTVLSSLHQHPEDCSKYVQCAGKVTFATSCLPNQCFGIESVNSCDLCSNVQCKSEITTEPEITTTEPTTTTTDKNVIPPIAMNCTKNSNFVGSGPANITCSFTPSASLNGIIMSRSVNSSSSVLGTVNSGGTLSDQSPDGIQLKYTPTNDVVLSVEISTMSCADQGTYDFIATQQDNVTYNGQEMLIAKAKPSNPILDLSHQTVVNKQSQAIVCKAQVGNPAGSIEVQVKQENEANFTTYKNFQTTATISKQLECNTEVELKVSQAFTSEWNNAKIRCTVKNDETIDANEDYSSNEDTLILIPDDYCNGVTGFIRHPRADCAYFIQCFDDGIFFHKCTGTDTCFNGIAQYCDYCYNVNSTTCNFP